MYHRAARTFWGLVAIGAAAAVGLTTHDAGFTVITFIGSLLVPRVLGLYPRAGWRRHMMGGFGGGPWREGCGPRHRQSPAGREQQPAQTV
ncbi:MAG: hypothetical protein JOZ46_01700 [Candidatus Dormibacteraeota bacterium]|nr:hypothetical protein [Candidatus Dormibacteraeota bacterium]